jgi:hypothetical protein
MRILFDKRPAGGFFGRAIRAWTNSPYLHCEILFDDGTRYAVDLANNPICGYIGKPGDSFNPVDWDCLEVPGVNEVLVRHFCDGSNGAKYDWLGIGAAMVLGVSRQSKTKWFCSEHAAAALRVGGIKLKRQPHHYSPGALFAELQAAGCQLVAPK